MRLDQYLASLQPDLSRSTIKKLIEGGQATVNGAVNTKASYNVAENDQVNLALPAAADFTQQCVDFATHNVVYENDSVVVVNKPAGMLTHAKGELTGEFTVADFVKSRFNPSEIDRDNNRLGIVHRLDRATSGILIAAKTLAAQSYLANQFATRRAHKVYLALTERAPKLDSAVINLPIARDIKSPGKFRVDGKGKSAITNYKTLAIYDDGSALVELRPLTGRTHQLRVHLSYINTPIVGDPIYGNSVYGSRLYLHAAELEITIPTERGNKRRTFRAPLPDDFASVIKVRHEVA